MCGVGVRTSGPFSAVYHPFSPVDFHHAVWLPRKSVCVRDIQSCRDPRTQQSYELDLDYFCHASSLRPCPVFASVADVLDASCASLCRAGGVCVLQSRVVCESVIWCAQYGCVCGRLESVSASRRYV